jgi:peptide deformylase
MLKLVKDPDPILQQRAEEWDFGLDSNADQIEDEMIDLMIACKGIGLAGNQVGLLKRVFVIQLANGRRMAMFNPEVVKASEEIQTGEEGCLSFPDLFLVVDRPATIDVKFLDKNAQECTMTLSGLTARCFLHELDHLNGICFTEKTSILKLAMARKKQQKTRNSNGRAK